MDLGTMVGEQIDAQGDKQQAVAAAWREAWNKKAKKPIAADTVESRLSDLRGDKLGGVKFFFGDQRRADQLRRTLNVPDDAWARWTSLAKARLDKDRQPAVIVDLASLDLPTTVRPTAYDGLLDLLRSQPGWMQEAVTVVLTAEQHRTLPRDFDSMSPRVAIVQVADAADAADKVRQLAGDNALVASPRPQPWPTWLELYADPKGRLGLEPADGVEAFVRDGSLGMPAALVPLRDLVGESKPVEADVLAGLVRPWRKIAELVASPDAPAEGSPAGKLTHAQRFAIARAAGLVAAAWPRELIENNLVKLAASLNAKPKVVTQTELDALLLRAATHPTGATAVRVADVVHVLNWDSARLKDAGKNERLQVHIVRAPEPALIRLRTALAALTTDDVFDDPFLDRVLDGLATSDADRRALAFARSCLWAHGHVKFMQPKLDAQLATEFASALQAGVVPMATAILHDAWASETVADGVERAKAPGILNVVPIIVHPGTAKLVMGKDTRAAAGPPCTPEQAKDGSKWLDAWMAFENKPYVLKALRFEKQKNWSNNELAWNFAVELAPVVWNNLQDHGEAIWMALAAALLSGRTWTRADGVILTELGNGVVARVSLRRYGAPGDMRIGIPVKIGELRGQYTASLDLTELNRGRAANYSFAAWEYVDVPSRVEFAVGGIRATVTFGASPYAASPLGRAPVTVGKIAADHQRAMDDDD